MRKGTRRENASIWQKLKAYRLHHNIYVLLALIIAVVVSTVAFYMLYLKGDQGFLFNLMIAISTSLLASIFCMLSDLILKYKECENDELIKGLHEYGICDLHFDKLELLKELMENSRKACWMSGYRLILTRKLIPQIEELVKNRIKIRILCCPPWSNAYKSVYGSNDQTIYNYCKIFEAVLRAAGSPANAKDICQVRYTDKPLFNDTYKVDNYLITGSYLHNRDKEHGRITAGDFFCFDLVSESDLYRLINNEYETLWEEAVNQLDWEKFAAIGEEDWNQDLKESERIEKLQSACGEITADQNANEPAIAR